MNSVKLYLNYAGYCWASERHAIRTGRNKQIKFQALWGLIAHPTKGYILYDTGYTNRFYQATSSFPSKIYAMMTKVEVTKEDEITHQLSSHQIDPSEIKHIIITHFHADHVGGLKDFPNAKIYASSTAIEHTIALGKTFSFTKGVLKDLLPDDLADRIVKIDQECPEASDQIFGTTYDLFDDNTIQIIPLPGHAAGQVGLMLQTIKSKYFLIADACWLKQSIEEKTLPNPIVKLFFHSWTDFKKSLEKIQLYHQQFPETIIVPTHCQESTRTLVSDKINFDVL